MTANNKYTSSWKYGLEDDSAKSTKKHKKIGQGVQHRPQLQVMTRQRRSAARPVQTDGRTPSHGPTSL